MATVVDKRVEELSINTIRTLAMDAVQQAGSGHPGTAMALAPLAYVLWSRFLRFNPKNPGWFDRDRFVLSNGHASILQYAMLHLTGYDLPLDELKNFRQWGSRTPGHPEYGHVPGVETTTGPLGQGVMTAVGMAIAEAHLAGRFNRDGHAVVDHHTYVFCGDGDLMEGASHEAASIAGHLGLGKLIYIFDDNHISIEGPTDIAFTEDVAGRFEAYKWHVQNVGDNANDIDRLAIAIEAARAETNRPSLIIVRSHIAFGAPTMQDTPEAHGAPLGDEEIKLTKRAYGWPEDKKFFVPNEVYTHMREAGERGMGIEKTWQAAVAAFKNDHPDLGAEFEAAMSGDLPGGWTKALPSFDASEKGEATRGSSGKVINAIADVVPTFLGGSADLAPSTKTLIKSSDYFTRDNPTGRNIAWGVREHGMCAASNGMLLHGGVRPFASTFFIFTDYARPAIRLAALMGIPVIFVMTHDSIGLGGDGPTHQPVEHLASLRAMPNMVVIRPGDANETVYAWRAAMERLDGPTMLVLSRQNVPTLDRGRFAAADGTLKGAYVLAKEKGSKPDIILIATGSEVALALKARDKLSGEGIDTRVVSMPSWELFGKQPDDYRESVLPSAVTKRVAIEAGSPQGWCRWLGNNGCMVGVTTFGASAEDKDIFENYGFTVDNVVSHVKKMMG